MTCDLLPDFAARAALLDAVSQRLNKHWEELPRRPVSPTFGLDEIQRRVGAFDFREPAALDMVLQESFDLLENGIVHSAHPRCFGLFNPTPSFASVLGEYITATFNPQLAVRSHGSRSPINSASDAMPYDWWPLMVLQTPSFEDAGSGPRASHVPFSSAPHSP